jgi:hypothetical protein
MAGKPCPASKTSVFGEKINVHPRLTDSQTKMDVWLVVLTILKHMKVNGKDDIPYIMENETCLKPPARCIRIYKD